ncbi:acyl carrier protein [Pseudoramibacter porci]|jgi:D-alanine--poly(phosphoribitol) ligase subunit 2|nr:acyl carrier protein [Pseudoramibacter porci]
MENMEEKIIEMLKENDDSIDYASETHLIDDGLLDSFGVIALVADLEDAFDVEIGTADLIPAHFNSVKAIAELIQKRL